MYNRYYTYAYIAFSIIPALYIVLSVKPKHRKISFILTYWFFIVPVVRSRLFRGINPFARITGQTWRIDWNIALLLISLLFMRYLTNKDSKLLHTKKMLQFEKYWYAYLYGSIIVIAFHVSMGNIDPEYMNISFFVYYQAIFLYFGLIHFIDVGTIKCFLKSFLFVSVFSSFVSIVQFFFNTWFFRTDRVPYAFQNYHRSTGIFQTPHDHSLFVLVAIFIVLFGYKNKLFKYTTISLFSVGIILTYSRGSWVSVLAVASFYLFTIRRSLFYKTAALLVGIVILFSAFSKAYTPDLSQLRDNKVVEERLLSDTATPRMMYNFIVFKTIAEKWMFGYGSKQNNEVYYKFMFEAGGKDWAMGRAGGIHNLVLEELFLKGTFTTIFLVLFFLNLFIFSYKIGMKRRNYLLLIVFYYNVGFLMYMMTAAAFLSSYVGILVVFTTAIISSVYYNDLDISEFTFELPESKKEIATRPGF